MTKGQWTAMENLIMERKQQTTWRKHRLHRQELGITATLRSTTYEPPIAVQHSKESQRAKQLPDMENSTGSLEKTVEES